MSALRDELHKLIDTLDENQLQLALSLVQSNVPSSKSLYREEEDPTVGLIQDGPTDLSEQGEDILLDEITQHGWSWKHDSSDNSTA